MKIATYLYMYGMEHFNGIDNKLYFTMSTDFVTDKICMLKYTYK
jgi:hypothetical protein